MNKLELLSVSVRTIIQADYFTHAIQLPAVIDFQNRKKISTVTVNIRKKHLSLNREFSESSFKFETGNFLSLRLTVVTSVFGSLFSQI
jgi:hypothetical protein